MKGSLVPAPSPNQPARTDSTQFADHSAATTVFRGGRIIADPASGRCEDHRCTVVNGTMLVAVNVPAQEIPGGATEVDCSGCVIMPGLINGHTHAAMSLLRGLADDVPLSRWLNDYIFPAEARFATPEFVRLGTTLAAAEMALNGITTFADGYFFMEEAALAAIDVGIRSVVAQGILDVPVPDAPEPGTWKQRVERFLDSFPQSPLVRPALFCHSPYLCGPDTLSQAAESAGSRGLLLFSHVSETAGEVEEIRKRYGKSPIEHLRDVGILGPGLVAVHGVHLDERERSVLAESQTRVVHCPEANLKLGSGMAPVPELLQAGVLMGLGTDGPASNNNLDLFEEMRSAALVAKGNTGNPEALSAREVLRMATVDGAQVLNLDEKVGTLFAGKEADVVIVDFRKPHLQPVYDEVSHLVYAARGSDVRDVMVRGNWVVRNRELTTVDVPELLERVRSMARDIAAGLGMVASARS